MDTILAIATVVLAAATAAMAYFTFSLAKETKLLAADWRKTSEDQILSWEKTSSNQIAAWHEASVKQIGVQTWLTLEARFDSKEVRRARAELAAQMEVYNPSKHDAVSEDFLELVESVAAVHNLGLLNKELASSSFSYYICHWWEATQAYIQQERRIRHNDGSLFSGFEKFAKAMEEGYPKVDSDALKQFLEEEKHLDIEARKREAAAIQPIFEWDKSSSSTNSITFNVVNRGAVITQIDAKPDAQNVRLNFSPKDTFATMQTGSLHILCTPIMSVPIKFIIQYRTGDGALRNKYFTLNSERLMPSEEFRE